MSTRTWSRRLAGRGALALALTTSALAATTATGSPASAGTLCGYTVNDTILAKARAAFGSSVCPTMSTATTPNGKGLYTHFNNNASIYWKSTASGAQPHVVLGLIRNKWSNLGWENGFLGFPTTDELAPPDGVGRFNHFEGGSIYWSPQTDAHSIQGDIRGKWAALGWEAGFLGYPTTDETTTPDGVGRFNHFRGGSIYWKNSIGPHVIYGQIRALWANQGWERGPLGYPISDETAAVLTPANRFNDFENGVLLYTASSNSTAQLGPFQTTAGASILQKVKDIITPTLQAADSRIHYRGDLSFAGAPADYYRDGRGSHNRQVRVNVPLQVYVTDPLPDPTIDLTLEIEINLNAGGTAVVAELRRYSWHVHVPFPTSVGTSADSIAAQLRRAIDPKLDQENPVQSVPVRPLSVKVMKDNSLQAFIG